MPTTENIERLTVEREQVLNRAKTIYEVAKDSDNRDLTTEEQSSQDGYLDRVESIDRELATLGRIESLEATRATPEPEPEPAQSHISVGSKRRAPGSLWAAQAVALHRNGNDRRLAADFARSAWGDELLAKVLETPPAVIERGEVDAGASGVPGWASELVAAYRHEADEFINLLRPMTVVSQLAPRRLSFNGSAGITIPKLAAGVAGGWVTELGGIPVNALETTSISLNPAKCGVIVVMAQELINQADPDVLEIVRDDMLRGTAQTVDSLFISATAASPPAPAGILHGISAIVASTASADRDKAVSDLKRCEAALRAANVPGPYTWIMSSTAHNSLMWMEQPSSYGFMFREELERGVLSGHSVLISNNTVTDDVILVAQNDLVYATGRAPEIDISNDATIHMSDAPDANLNTGAGVGPVTTTPVRSLWQTDAQGARLISSWAWAMRRAEAVAWVDGIGW